MSQHFLGIDPDLHHTGIASVLTETLKEPVVSRIEIIQVPSSLKRDRAVVEMARVLNRWREGSISYIDGIAVEAQHLHVGGKADPRSILLLAACAGAALCAIAGLAPANQTLFPFAQEWKGSNEKWIKHEQILRAVGWEFERKPGNKVERYRILPRGSRMEATPGANAIKDGSWSHAIDAIGLALWAGEQVRVEQKRKRLLGK